MTFKITPLLGLVFLLAACNGESTGSSAPMNPGKAGTIEDWQSPLMGQEGHGGDAIVCFSIPVDLALEKVGPEKKETCGSSGSCPSQIGSTRPVDLPSSGVTWKMTAAGRNSISSAKPLEQYLAERIQSKKAMIDQLNQMSVEDGYRSLLSSFANLPAAASRLSDVHRQLGWLEDDGISSEYGLRDINDSGFVNESEIDTVYCKELQAVVRRDSQLWYDRDIIRHFDNAGKVLIQLHEEIYFWGKSLDKINLSVGVFPQHETSVSTRRLILKLLDSTVDTEYVNETLKSLGFSVLYNETFFNVPTSAGYYMDSGACLGEQIYIRDYVSRAGYEDFEWKMERLFSSRYLATSRMSMLELKYNFPDALSEMISFTLTNGSSPNFASQFELMLKKFERPESCEGSI